MSMMIPEPKRVATIIVSRMGKDGNVESSESKPEAAMGEPLHELAQDLLHAIETKSPTNLAAAFKAMFLQLELREENDVEDPEQPTLSMS